MSEIEELLRALRKESRDSSFIPVLEQAQKLRNGPLRGAELGAVPKKRKRKTDRRTLRKRVYAWRREHADELREYNAGLRQMFFHLRREAKRRFKAGEESWKWELSLAEWINMWLSCPAVLVGTNAYKPAWQCRGRDSSQDVQLRRVDTTKSWNINNLEIWHQKKRLWPSS